MDRLAPSMLAALVTLSTGFATVDAVYAPAARADEEEVRQHELLYSLVNTSAIVGARHHNWHGICNSCALCP